MTSSGGRAFLMVVIALLLASCRSTGMPSQPTSNRDAAVGLRVVYVEPASIWQLTSAPFRQGIVVEVTEETSNLVRDTKVKLIIMYGPQSDASFLIETEGGILIDESIVRGGTYLLVRTPLKNIGTCPAPALESHFSDPVVGDTYDDLPCFEVGVSRVKVQDRGSRSE